MVAGSSNGGRCSCMLLLLVSPLSPNQRQSNNNGNHSDDEWMIPGAPIKLPRPPHESNMQTTLWRCTTGTPGNNTQTNTNAKAHTHTHAHTHIQTVTLTYTQTQMHTETHTHTHTQRHKHTHGETRTHGIAAAAVGPSTILLRVSAIWGCKSARECRGLRHRLASWGAVDCEAQGLFNFLRTKVELR